MQEVQSHTILTGYSDQEKGAYLGAIASLATADRKASDEELDHLEMLAESAGLTVMQREAVLRAAEELDGSELLRCLDILKNSELRFSLVADLITFAELDNDFSPEERANIQKVSEYLGVNKSQYSLLDQFVQRTSQSNKTPQEISRPGFLESLGLKDQFSKAGINSGSMGRGVLGMLGPMVLGGLISRGLGGRRTGNVSGGGFGSLGMGRNIGRSGGMGGFGSIFSALGGGRSSSGMGGLLSRFLR